MHARKNNQLKNIWSLPSILIKEVKVNFNSPVRFFSFSPTHSLTMAESQYQSVPTHPIAPRVKGHHKKSHVGPDINAYRDHHAKTVEEGSDEWWAQVRLFTAVYAHFAPRNLMITTPTDRQRNSLLGPSLQDRSKW